MFDEVHLLLGFVAPVVLALAKLFLSIYFKGKRKTVTFVNLAGKEESLVVEAGAKDYEVLSIVKSSIELERFVAETLHKISVGHPEVKLRHGKAVDFIVSTPLHKYALEVRGRVDDDVLAKISGLLKLEGQEFEKFLVVTRNYNRMRNNPEVSSMLASGRLEVLAEDSDEMVEQRLNSAIYKAG